MHIRLHLPKYNGLALSVAGFCVSSPLQTLVAGGFLFYMHSVYG